MWVPHIGEAAREGVTARWVPYVGVGARVGWRMKGAVRWAESDLAAQQAVSFFLFLLYFPFPFNFQFHNLNSNSNSNFLVYLFSL
jgi:hypothetical protein